MLKEIYEINVSDSTVLILALLQYILLCWPIVLDVTDPEQIEVFDELSVEALTSGYFLGSDILANAYSNQIT